MFVCDFVLLAHFSRILKYNERMRVSHEKEICVEN